MSAANAVAEAPPAKGKKKLIMIVAAALLVVAAGGGAAVFMMKKKAAEAAEAEGDDAAPAAAQAAVKHDPKAVPTFVALDPFTVNLADRDAERYAQVGITLEISDAHLEAQIKSYMPSIRNNILMAIADRTAGELMGREGKAKLAESLRRETARALGYALEEEVADATADATAGAKVQPKKKKKRAEPLPIKAVHFSNFIIQ